MVVVSTKTLDAILRKSKMEALLLNRNFENNIPDLVNSIKEDNLGYVGEVQDITNQINNNIKPSKIRIGVGINPQGRYLLYFYADDVQPIEWERRQNNDINVTVVVPYGAVELNDEDWNRLSKLLVRYLQHTLEVVKGYFGGNYIKVDNLTKKKSGKYFKVEEIASALIEALNETISMGVMDIQKKNIPIKVKVYRESDGNYLKCGKYEEKINDCWKLMGVTLRLLKVLKDEYRNNENIDKIERLWKFGIMLYNAAMKLYSDCKFKEYNIEQ